VAFYVEYNDNGDAGHHLERKRMTFLFDANVAYFLLTLGFVLAVLALFTPGTGILEIGALLTIVLAGYALFNLTINWWALLILIVGILPFVFAMRKRKQWYWLIGTVVFFSIGAVFLVPAHAGVDAVNPIFAIFLNMVSVFLLWFIGRKSIDAMKEKPAQDLKRIIGMVGEARTAIHNSGTVYVGGEEWSARSEETIREGSSVKVIGREGLVLIVEMAK
jgi:membrane-bound serine protease (ClpP class)